MPADQWFLLDGAKQEGPFTEGEALKRVWRAGNPVRLLAWREGMPEWQAVAEIQAFAANVPPPMPTSSRARPLPDQEVPTLNPVLLWARCFSWRGRFSRAEFATAYFGVWLVLGPLFLGVGGLAGLLHVPDDVLSGAMDAAIGLLSLVLIPLWAGAGVRRLHDCGLSGWLILLVLIPCVGLFMLIYLLATPGSGVRAVGTAPARTSVLVGVALLIGVLSLLGLLVVFTQGTALFPFLHTLF